MRPVFIFLFTVFSFSIWAGNVGVEYLGMIRVSSSTSVEVLDLYSCSQRGIAIHQLKLKARFANMDFYGSRAEMEDRTYQRLPNLRELGEDRETDWIDIKGDPPCLKNIQLTVRGDSNIGHLEVWGMTERVTLN